MDAVQPPPRAGASRRPALHVRCVAQQLREPEIDDDLIGEKLSQTLGLLELVMHALHCQLSFGKKPPEKVAPIPDALDHFRDVCGLVATLALRASHDVGGTNNFLAALGA